MLTQDRMTRDAAPARIGRRAEDFAGPQTLVSRTAIEPTSPWKSNANKKPPQHRRHGSRPIISKAARAEQISVLFWAVHGNAVSNLSNFSAKWA